MQATLDEHATKIDIHDRKLIELADQVKLLQESLAMADKKPSSPIKLDSGFERDAGGTVIKSSAGKMVAKSVVVDAIAPWLAEAGFADEWWSIEARNPISRNYDSGGPAKLHISGNETTRQVKMEIPGRKLDPQEGRQATAVKWCQTAINKYCSSKMELVGAIESAAEPKAEPQWCL
ncbi:unnamed protein product [Prorocentrum cordatum]|uniref:Activator of Hsp90 ATPase N-terminal domain-containing protein n=1 Tax=Prorocentrum cordatum TaxID=2364126 RepID=A0ABN9SX87_9DINO|nr:unnamed protein product [Polarella glacialis]